MKKIYFSPDAFIVFADDTDVIMVSGSSREADYVNVNAEFGGGN